jgi:hypothetical protein
VVHEVQLVLTPLHSAQPVAQLEHVLVWAGSMNWLVGQDVKQLVPDK